MQRAGQGAPPREQVGGGVQPGGQRVALAHVLELVAQAEVAAHGVVDDGLVDDDLVTAGPEEAQRAARQGGEAHGATGPGP